MNVLLDDYGIFAVATPDGFDFVYFAGGESDAPQPERRDDHWLRVVQSGENGSPALVGMFLDLDEALAAIVGRESFQIVLPDGRRFSRPGRKPSVEVLASMGFEIVRRASVFAILDLPDHLSQEEVRLEVASKLVGRGINVGAAERIDEDRSEGWSVEILIPLEGVYSAGRLHETVRRYLDGADLEIAAHVEIDGVELPTCESATVIPVVFGKRPRPV